MSDLPRLLLCSFDVIPGPSGSSRRLTEYLKALPDRFSVVVLSAKTPDHSHIEKYQGARLLRVPVGSGDLASRIQSFERAVRRQLESEDYALAHFTDPFGGYALCELKADYGYRLIYEAQTFPSQELRYTHPQTDGDRRFLSKIRRQELFCLMNADLVVTGSQTTRGYIQGLGAAEDQLRMLRAPVDLKPYDPEVLGAPDGTPLRMMYLGSHVGWQGLPTLLRATALAAQQVDVRLTLVGAHHPDWKPHLDDLVKDLGLKEKVDFQPPVVHDDLFKVLALADVGVLPMDDSERNRVQGGPLAKVSEYMAAGRPVIAADLPVTRELIPQDAAVFFPPGDSRALSERIVELSRDVPRRVALGRAGRAHAEKVLDAGLIRGQLLDLYDSLLKNRGNLPVGAANEPPDVTMTGTPTNRLANLGMPESSRPAPVPKPPAKPAAPDSALEASAPEPAANKEGAEDLPLVMGMALEEGLDTRLVKTEPDMRPDEVPMVLGLPLRERAPASAPARTEAPASVDSGSDTARTTLPAAPTKEEPEPLGGRRGEPGPPTELVTSFSAKALSSRDSTLDTSSRDAGNADTAPRGQGDDAAHSGPTPVVRRSALEDEGEAPAPTPIVRRPAPTEDEEKAPTPIVRRPSSLASEDEEKAPTPIVRRSGVTREEESPAPTPIVRRSSVLVEDFPEPPAPTPIVPMRSVMNAGRSTNAGRSDSKPPRLAFTGEPPSAATEPPRSPPLPSMADADKPPIRGGLAADPGRPASPRTPPPVLSESDKPPIRGGGLAGDADKPPIRGGGLGSDADRPPQLPPRAVSPPPVPRQGPPPRLMPSSPEGQARSGPPVLKPSSPASADDEPEEIAADEAESLDDDGSTTPSNARAALDEPEEISSDEVHDADSLALEAADAEDAEAAVSEEPPPAPPGSTLNPWFAQLAHGYCPPEGAQFARHTPPTNFPGRDPEAGTPPPVGQGAVRNKNT
ncbi:glycosyltransferase [Corallococcus praedator]|uniref:Glycosyltransferase n=1 Tax=Corallococcus praedator TaxID=2316724 RepID=A0ABX9QPP2_9BACT|nr:MULTISPECIES: glycosyltransferase family 4 protein [Corallococcus]RKH34350.1 glycosyltransferase [Corallococcus sp. CA031C]RKI15853.1 glycosyltransferase [Corallococcus praedator]